MKRLYYKIILGIGSLLFLFVLFIWRQPFVAVEYITRDPSAIAKHPLYYGALSNLGVLLWCASTTACLVAGLVAKAFCNRHELVGFFAAFGGLSAMLCMDDLFLIHEGILPKLGISEKVMFAFYAIALSYMLLHFRKILLKTQPVFLGISLFLFTISMSSDLIPALDNLPRDDAFALEDGSKFVAIFAWFAYFLWISVEEITLLASGFSVRSGDLLNAIPPAAQEDVLSNLVE